MKLRECIDRADNLNPNQYKDEEKVRWLSVLDARIHDDLLMHHEPVPVKAFTGYDMSNINDELIAPFPYDELYVYYLLMKFDEANKETAEYNNSSRAFNMRYDDYAKYVNRTQKPVNKAKFRIW